MEKDFHYFLIYAIASTTGFEDADIIAFASQFVDDNNEGQFSIDGQEAFFPKKIPFNGGHYFPIMTQSLSPKSLDTYVQKYVYMPFHFLPGDQSQPIDGEINAFATTPGSPIATQILKNALASNNPYQIGIALHSYADTWSHQNFTGFQENWNSVYPWYNVFKSIVPNIGHAEAGHSPDVISETWTDHRLKQKIVNTDRAFKATGQIYQALRRKSGSGPLWSVVSSAFKAIIRARDYDARIADISAYLPNPIPNYNKNEWIDAALDREGDKIVMRDNFEQTHWYRFHQAAKTHFAQVMELTKTL